MCEDLRIGIPWQWKTARVKWLRLCTSTARGTGLNPGQGTKISHTIVCEDHSMWNSKKKKKKKKEKTQGYTEYGIIVEGKISPFITLRFW